MAPDYHIEIAGHYYSVPSRLIRETVEASITRTTVEIFHKGTRVATHAFSPVRHRHTTVTEHMRYAEGTPAWMKGEAARLGRRRSRYSQRLCLGSTVSSVNSSCLPLSAKVALN